jgi:hypothetical protein
MCRRWKVSDAVINIASRRASGVLALMGSLSVGVGQPAVALGTELNDRANELIFRQV